MVKNLSVINIVVVHLLVIFLKLKLLSQNKYFQYLDIFYDLLIALYERINLSSF